MDLKKKFAVGVCAVALTSMMASPAFAADWSPADANKYTNNNGVQKENPGANADIAGIDGLPVINEFDIHAQVIDTTKIIKVLLPTSVTVGYKTDGSNVFLADGFVGPDNAKVTNMEDSSGAIHVGIATLDQPTGFFDFVTAAPGKSMLNVKGTQMASLVAATTPGTATAYQKLSADSTGLAKKTDMPLSFTSDLAAGEDLTTLKTALATSGVVKTQFKVSLEEGDIV